MRAARTCRTGRCRWGAFLALPLLLAASAAAVEVAEVRWGFDGSVVPERIGVLSLLLTNAEATAYDGVVTLHRTDGLGSRLGATHVEPCFVAPFTSRWVQFHPYVARGDEEWIVTLGKQQTRLRGPALGAPAAVCLRAPDDPFQRPGGLRSLPDNLFPTTLSATDGLASLVMDYAPLWEQPRRQALLDWLRRGGRLYLLRGQDGGYPGFAGELSVLNDPARRFRVGAGLVVRGDGARDKTDGVTLADAGLGPPVLESGDRASMWTLEDAVFQELGGLVRPEHNWTVIYISLALYMLLVSPINYIIGRKKAGFLRATLFFVAAVAGFAVLLSTLGRRGYGETSAVHSVSYARSLGGSAYDVTQWVNVFVRDGDYYKLTHQGDHNLYATCQGFERVNGVIRNGRQGEFLVDIPLFSSRSFLYRGKLEGPDLGVKVVRWGQEDGAEKVMLSTGEGFPLDVAEIWAFRDGRFYHTFHAGGRIGTTLDGGSDISSFLSKERLQLGEPYLHGYGSRGGGGDKDPERALRGQMRTLIARAIGGTKDFRYYLGGSREGKDHVQLFIYANMPGTFAVAGRDLGREVGYVLYHLDVFKPEEADG